MALQRAYVNTDLFGLYELHNVLKFYSNWFYIDFRTFQMSANQEAQSDELLALASIYDEEEFA